MGSLDDRKWWKEAVVLQIWTHSYCDSNGDGVGDLPGIISKIDYIKSLGVSVIWLSPVYPSPMKDFGYDISDFCDISPLYGELSDWDKLKEECDKRGIKILMDLVLNHCSDQHPWFIEARASKSSKYRDWFIWRDENDLNNWQSVFEGSVWELTEETGQYYMHMYAKEQPDLNWENPEVREAMYDVAKFWLDRGCAGFRLDAVSRLSRVHGLPDAPVTKPGRRYQPPDKLVKHGPRLQEFFKELHEKVLSKYDGMTVGEMSGTTPEKALEYVHPSNKQLNMIFQFDHSNIDSNTGNVLKLKDWVLPDFKALTAKWQAMQSEGGGWCAWHKENHDLGRSLPRLGDDRPEWRALSAQALAMYDATLPGTTYIYQGEELGVTKIPESFTIEDFLDVQTQRYWKVELEHRRELTGEQDPDMADILSDLRVKARDNGRLPIRWDDSKSNAGFTTGKPWMKMNPDDAGWSVAQQDHDPQSVLNFWRKVLALRKEYTGLIYGKFVLVDSDHASMFVYTVEHSSGKFLVVMNWSDKPVKGYYLPLYGSRPHLLLCNYPGEPEAIKGDVVDMVRGWEASLYTLV